MRQLVLELIARRAGQPDAVIVARQPHYKVGDVLPDGVRKWMAQIETLPYFAKTTPPHWRPQ